MERKLKKSAVQTKNWVKRIYRKLFEVVSLDILDHLSITTHGNGYMLVVMDYFTKWLEASSLPSQEALTVAKH